MTSRAVATRLIAKVCKSVTLSPRPCFSTSIRKKISVPGFYIDTFEVSSAQYKTFVLSTGRKPLLMWTENAYGFTPDQLQVKTVEALCTLATDVFKLDKDARSMNIEALIIALQDQQKAQDAIPAWGHELDGGLCILRLAWRAPAQ